MLSTHANTIKLVANVVTTVSVGSVVKQIIRSNVEEPETLPEKAKLLVGSFAIGGLITERCWERLEVRIDGAIALVDKFQQAQEEQEIPEVEEVPPTK